MIINKKGGRKLVYYPSDTIYEYGPIEASSSRKISVSYVNVGLSGLDIAQLTYDFDNDYVYANYGWGSSNTHIALPTISEPTTAYNFNHIRHIAVFNFSNMGHSHSNNYVIYNIGYCGCNPNNAI